MPELRGACSGLRHALARIKETPQIGRTASSLSRQTLTLLVTVSTIARIFRLPTDQLRLLAAVVQAQTATMMSSIRFSLGRKRFTKSLDARCALPWLLGCAAWLAATWATAQTAESYIAYPLHHQQAARLEPTLRELLVPWQDTAQIVIDVQTNQLLIRGPAEVHRVVKNFLSEADQPTPQLPTPKQDEHVLRSYRLEPSLAPTFVDALRREFAADPSVRIASDGTAGQLFVLATPAVHDAIRARIQASKSSTEPVSTGVGDGAQTNQTLPAHGPSSSSLFVSLARSEPRRVKQRLLEIAGPNLQAIGEGASSADRFVWKIRAGTELTILFNPQRHGVELHGSGPTVRQAALLLRALDASPPAGGATKVLHVRRAMPALQRGAQDTATPLPHAPPNPQVRPDQSSNALPSRVQQAGVSDASPTRVLMAAFLDETGDSATAENDKAGTEKEAQQDTGRLLRQLGMDVDLQVLPNLDVIILRGRDEDVQHVTDIIRELERIAEQAEPQAEIVRLRHARAGAIATLIQQTQVALLQGRQGRAVVYSLETPNAILLIGWGEALSAARGLIEKLDEPVAASAQLKIFHLKHATAAVAATAVQQFFAGQTGLGPAVKVIADARSNALIVHAAPRDLDAVAALIEQLDVEQAASVEQMRIFKLSHALAADLAATIRTAVASVRGQAGGKSSMLEFLTVDAEGERIIQSGILNNIRITSNTQTNSLIVTGPAKNMDLVAVLIKQLDTPISTSQIKVFRIVNGDASSLVLMLRSLLPTQTGASTRPQLAGAEGESSLAPIRFSVERRTNSIIATGSAGDLRIIEALLLRLDENDMQRRRNTVHRLKNAPAVDVAQAINNFLTGKRRVFQLAPGELSLEEQTEREVIVVPEPVSNALIISATPRFYDDIMDLVERLDAQPPQVMIQVLIAEVSLANVDEFGVELGLQDSVLFDRSLLGNLLTTTNTVSASTPAGIVTNTNQIIQSATNVPGFQFNNTGPLGNSGSSQSLSGSNNVGAQGISNFAVGRVNNELGFGGLVLSASSESVSVLIRALQESRRMDVLSRPQIMTLDNQPAFIQVGQRVPRITQTQLTNFGQINTVELDNVGLILGVTPRVSPKGTVVMEIDAEKSEVGEDSQGIPIAISPQGEVIRSPRFNITTAQTTVSATSGETIVLGGLIVKRNNKIARRVPLLADIPLLGDLFRYDFTDSRRAELLIILTPHVILGPEDNERIKRMESSRMSWCAADVRALQGDTGKGDQTDNPISNRKVPVIYPDLNPRGVIVPEEMVPSEQDGSSHRGGRKNQSSREWVLPPARIAPQTLFVPDKTGSTSNAAPTASAVRPASLNTALPAYSNLAMPRDGKGLTRLPPLSATDQQLVSEKTASPPASSSKPRPHWMRWFGAGRN